MAQQQHYRSPFGDTTFTKVFVGGLAWETPTAVMRGYFEQFGNILEAVIINDKNTGKSKGYGFVTFGDPESARRACLDPNPVIDGRRANCNIASLGRPRPSPPRGRNQYQTLPGGLSSQPYRLMPPPPPPPPPVVYPPYGYAAAYPSDYGFQQAMYNPQMQQAQYYNQVYAASPSSPASSSPYYYGYSGRGTFSMPPAHRPPYLYYPTQVDPTSAAYSSPLPLPPPPPPLLQPPPRLISFPPSSTTEMGGPTQTSTDTEAGPATTSTSSTTA